MGSEMCIRDSNLGGATCADVLALCDEVRAIVKEKTGYDLEKEIRVVKA